MKVVIALLIGFIIIFAGPLAAEMSFTATVDKLSVAFEEKIHLQLEVKVSDPSVKTTPIPPPDIVGMQIGGSGSSVERQGNLTVRNYLYELVPARSGQLTIPSFRVEFQGNGAVDTLSSEPITVDIAQPKPISGPRSFVVFYSAAAVILIITVVALVRRKRGSRESEPDLPDWREEYRQRFSEVSKLAERQDFRGFSSEAMRLVVAIVERKYEAKLPGLTATDLLRWLEQRGLDKESLTTCKGLFDFCESVKFSTGKVDVPDGMLALNRAGKIVELLLN
jgi:hypothetical protein